MKGKKKENSQPIIDHYDAAAKNYHKQYEKDKLYDIATDYPANYFRLQSLLKSFKNKNIKSVIEVGVGEGTPLVSLAKLGIDAWGFDISRKMVKKAKENFQKNNLNPGHIFFGDIQKAITYSRAFRNKQFDGLVAMGVMPHVINDDLAISNMAALIRPGGSVFVEFRNKLFSLFTFNRYTRDFILNDLLKDVNDEIKKIVSQELETILHTDLPPVRTKSEDSKTAPGYDAILSKFHNPFEVIELFKKHNFKDIVLRWYHFHPAMPYLSDKAPELFRKEAIKLEAKSSDWRGMFMCSAFVVEAVKGD